MTKKQETKIEELKKLNYQEVYSVMLDGIDDVEEYCVEVAQDNESIIIRSHEEDSEEVTYLVVPEDQVIGINFVEDTSEEESEDVQEEETIEEENKSADHIISGTEEVSMTDDLPPKKKNFLGF